MRQPNYKLTTTLPERNLSFVEMCKTKTALNKPIHCGMSILDLSKTLTYNFYYNRLKREYEDQVNLLYTDTDSLLLSVHTDDVYGHMKNQRAGCTTGSTCQTMILLIHFIMLKTKKSSEK